MPAIERVDDKNDDWGRIESSLQSTVFANKKLVSVTGSPVSSHGRHFDVKTGKGSPTVFIDGKSVNRKGDQDSCGHIRDDGSEDVFVE